MQAFPRHSLSQAALLTSGAPIFLLDAFSVIIIFYAPDCPPDLPFPPGPSTTIRKVCMHSLQGK